MPAGPQNKADAIPTKSSAEKLLAYALRNGSFYSIDMQMFPLRLADNDLLEADLYREIGGDVITPICVRSRAI